MTYDPMDTHENDNNADGSVTIDEIDVDILRGLDFDSNVLPAGKVTIEEENGEKVLSAPTQVDASGGTRVVDRNIDGKDYRVHFFENVGNDTFIVNEPGLVDVLAVGGGGSGGESMGAGGGGGGVVFSENVELDANSYSVVVGDGARPDGQRQIVNGDNSSFDNIVAIGGGGGSSLSTERSDGIDDGNAGGSGGGSGAGDNGGSGGAALQPTSASGGFGNPGGNAPGGGNHYPTGGGGGAGEPGGSPANSGSRGGDGGDGIQINFTGNNYYWGGGGGGGAYTAGAGAGNGGLGGGGGGTASGPKGVGGGLAINSGQDGQSTSGESNTPGGDGGENTGGGGGGGDWGDNSGAYIPSDGGSGIVIVRYRI